jgi:hypothetical protein
MRNLPTSIWNGFARYNLESYRDKRRDTCLSGRLAYPSTLPRGIQTTQLDLSDQLFHYVIGAKVGEIAGDRVLPCSPCHNGS